MRNGTLVCLNGNDLSCKHAVFSYILGSQDYSTKKRLPKDDWHMCILPLVQIDVEILLQKSAEIPLLVVLRDRINTKKKKSSQMKE